jgi:hypothetical protein
MKRKKAIGKTANNFFNFLSCDSKTINDPAATGKKK